MKKNDGSGPFSRLDGVRALFYLYKPINNNKLV